MFFHDLNTILKTTRPIQAEETKEEKVSLSFFASLFKEHKTKTITNEVTNEEEEKTNILYIFKKYPFISFFAVLFLIGFIYDRNRDFFLGDNTIQTSTLSPSSTETKNPNNQPKSKQSTKHGTDVEKISLSNIAVVSKKSKQTKTDAQKTNDNVHPIQIKPKTKNNKTTTDTNKPSKKEKILTLKRKSIGVISSDISFDILSDKTRILLSTIPYSKNSKLKEGFYISDLGLNYNGEKKIEDIKITAIVKYKDLDTPIRKLSRSISDLYTISYYEDGIEINSKSSEKTSGIVLPGEKLSSEFTLKSVEMLKDKFAYSLDIKGKVYTFFINEEKVQ